MTETDNTKPSNDNFSFVEAEHAIASYWEKADIFQRSLHQTEKAKPYIFYDGPPFATGLPHHGHLVGSVLKDAIPRYFTMKGNFVQRRFGWDCHGLPIEHEIDKALGMSSQEAVAKLGLKGYNDECRKIVQRYTAEWEKTITRLGRWVDFKNDYKTMEPWYMESVWWVVKQLWEKGLIYRGEKVVPFSTALGTVLSNFEATSNYQNVQDPAITVLFKLKDGESYLAAWTTTPWTLPCNQALCINTKVDYVTVLDTDLDKSLIIAKDRLDFFTKIKNLEVIDTMPGEALVGRRYEPLFPYFTNLENEGAFQILEDDYVSTDTGTGIVHQAPAFGEDDFRIWKKNGFSNPVCPVDMEGKFTEEVTDFASTHVKKADKNIIRYLKESGSLYIQDVLVHSYPFCPRSDTPIIYRTIDSWYVQVEKIREKLIEVNSKINWVPAHIKTGRMGNWLSGAVDWAISRNRYWGTPLPIWINDETGNSICIGSRKELLKYTGASVDDLHRENVDNLTFAIEKEPGTYRRVEEVLDCWFESGAMPYAQLHFPFENKELFEKGFPAEYIAEGLDQTRGWFYTLIVLGTALFGVHPFKNVIVNGIVMAEDGKKMSKRLRNYTPPDELMESYGADALRLYLINSGLVRAEEQRFADTGVRDMVRRALLPWLNSFKFFTTYASIDGWLPNHEHIKIENIMDRWILSRLQSLKATITSEMERYRIYNVVPALFEFIDDLTNCYIRYNRSRFWSEENTDDKASAYQTLYTAIKELSTSLAPFAPFLAESIYRDLPLINDDPESVHLCNYPSADHSLIDPVLEKAVTRMQHIVLLGRQKRNQEKIKIKYPLSRMTIIHEDSSLLKEIVKLESYILSELNVKELIYSTDENKYIDLYAKPNSPVLGKRLGGQFKFFKEKIESLSPIDIIKFQEEGETTINNEQFSSGEILVFREPKAGTETLSNRFISIELNTVLTNDLIEEGLAREVVNRVQKSRKDLGFNVADRIHIYFEASKELEQAIENHKQYIKEETLALKMTAGKNLPISFKIEDYELSLHLKVIN
ncbi:MAG: isoleucine--tRNA ligase [Candidatus Azotimanducaceae bacterium]|uniref:Isoleucine--tRNA ligase n=1 Tax=OM182 bacterium TaxID=2510334 RepID=A0A520S3P4_9GAMM|nr:isoleucine--tRNA ligase [Gammaproteobacteria bacterium]OUV67631.1 MAG: isoleucine--tRNA ligase [Gammaproteobacteria bacterium TMED133]RZO77097.1 MAG: isoleucine--tRNA ligase [OM182 bacterium]